MEVDTAGVNYLYMVFGVIYPGRDPGYWMLTLLASFIAERYLVSFTRDVARAIGS